MSTMFPKRPTLYIPARYQHLYAKFVLHSGLMKMNVHDALAEAMQMWLDTHDKDKA